MNTKSNVGFKVDFISGKIFVKRSFVKAASIINSNEYREVIQLRRDFPNFTFETWEIKKKEGKKTYRNLTYANMSAYISALEGENSPSLGELERMKKLAKVQPGQYGYVKKWFLAKYPNYADIECAEDVDDIESEKVVSFANS